MVDLKDHPIALSLSEAIRFFGQRGWVPATSSNFSFRVSEECYAISISGRDKSVFSPDDLMIIDTNLQVLGDGAEHKPSAETQIHFAIYELYAPQVVLHTHSVNATVLSMNHGSGRDVVFQGYEIEKGLDGVKSHEDTVSVPIYSNSQDMSLFSSALLKDLKTRESVHGFLIEGHGLYTWGKSVFEAKRHVEVFEFLFECRLKEMGIT